MSIVKAKISYKEVDKSSYQTDTRGVAFQVTINGVKANGVWTPIGRYVTHGVDIDELRVDGRSVRIFSGGGSYRTYEIVCYNIPLADKQPKNLRFTGHRLSIKHLKPTFINRLLKAFEDLNAEPQLTQDFLKTFRLQ